MFIYLHDYWRKHSYNKRVNISESYLAMHAMKKKQFRIAMYLCYNYVNTDQTWYEPMKMAVVVGLLDFVENLIVKFPRYADGLLENALVFDRLYIAKFLYKNYKPYINLEYFLSGSFAEEILSFED